MLITLHINSLFLFQMTLIAFTSHHMEKKRKKKRKEIVSNSQLRVEAVANQLGKTQP